MATFSSNTTIKINSVSKQTTSSTSTTLTFTVPANCYAIATAVVACGSSGSVSISINSIGIATATGTNAVATVLSVYLTAGDVITATTSSGATTNAVLSCTSFINSP